MDQKSTCWRKHHLEHTKSGQDTMPLMIKPSLEVLHFFFLLFLSLSLSLSSPPSLSSSLLSLSLSSLFSLSLFSLSLFSLSLFLSLFSLLSLSLFSSLTPFFSLPLLLFSIPPVLFPSFSFLQQGQRCCCQCSQIMAALSWRRRSWSQWGCRRIVISSTLAKSPSSRTCNPSPERKEAKSTKLFL